MIIYNTCIIEVNINRGDKYAALSNVSMIFMKNIKNLRKTINLNFQFKHGMIQKIVTGNPPIKIYVIKIENRITFKIKTWYYSELLTPETMKLVGITNSKTPPVVTGIVIQINLKHNNIPEWEKYSLFINYWCNFSSP